MRATTTAEISSPAVHAAFRHDLIRVQGGRENYLQDVGIEIPKRRVTVFTGVSGSGKSSLVFDTIAVRIRQLRQKVDDGHAVRLIHTVYGQGYVLRAPESEEDRPAG